MSWIQGKRGGESAEMLMRSLHGKRRRRQAAAELQLDIMGCVELLPRECPQVEDVPGQNGGKRHGTTKKRAITGEMPIFLETNSNFQGEGWSWTPAEVAQQHPGRKPQTSSPSGASPPQACTKPLQACRLRGAAAAASLHR